MNSDKPFDCKYITQCSGCQIAHLSKADQVNFKLKHFSELWVKDFNQEPVIEFLRPFESKFRDRMDVTVYRDRISQSCDDSDLEKIENQKIGFYKKDSRDILDIDECLLNSENLSRVLAELRKINFPVLKGSLRIRVSPEGKKGLWIDFSNQDIKKLIDESNDQILKEQNKISTFQKLLDVFDIVEVGQRRKMLTLTNGIYKLTDPTVESWFETYDGNLNPIPLKMNIGGFSQSGFKTNKVLVSALIKTLKAIQPHLSLVDSTTKKAPWVELCSGSGNLTLPLVRVVENVIATELDENAVNSLKQTAQELGISDRLEVLRINIHKPSQEVDNLLKGARGILADPPRSGLQGFLEVISNLEKKDLPEYFLYVSCFAETLISDLKILTDIGYEPQKIIGVDQFPHSTHCEWMVLLKNI